MTQPRAAIFDLDGTLLDTLHDLADSANEALAAAGLPVHPVDAYRTFVGDGMNVLIQRILPEERNNDETVAHLLELYRAAYGRRWNSKSRPYAGIPEMLHEISSHPVMLAVLSNKPQKFTELCIEHLLPENSFQLVYGQRDNVPRKPDPTGALEIAEAFQTPPEQCLFIGDTRTDMLTALGAGMRAIGVSWGFRSVEELMDSGAERVIHHPAELLELLS